MSKKIIAVSATHGCFGIDTLIRMYDGTIKKVQDIQINDFVMGDDSTPRRVLLLHRGKEELFEFEYMDGIKHVYNKSHELVLQYSQTSNASSRRKGDTIVVEVNKYLAFSNNRKLILCKFNKPIVRSTDKILKIPPYILGVWLGGGKSKGTKITNVGDCIIKELANFVEKNNLRFYNLLSNKHIPIDYFNSSLENRLMLLAGLLDTDGYLNNRTKQTYEIVQKNKALAYDIFYLARSCGMHSTIKKINRSCTNNKATGSYYQISLTRGFENIPCKVRRKQAISIANQKRPTTRAGVRNITSLGVGNYYGFTLDGNNLFLHADCTVLKNCGKTTVIYGMAAFLKKLGKNVAVINELARECPFPINQVADDRTQAWISTKQVTKEFEKMDRYDYLLVDRSVLDPICYSRVLNKTESISLLLTDYLAEHIRTYYSRLYLLDPILFDWNVVDNVRDNDEKFRSSVHETMYNLFNDLKLPYKLIKSTEEIYSDLLKL